MTLKKINLIFCFAICFSFFSCKNSQKDATSEHKTEVLLSQFKDDFTRNLFVEGQKLLEQGNIEEAKIRFYEVYEIEPLHAFVLNTLAEVENNYGDKNKAIEICYASKEAHPEYLDTYVELSKLLIEQGEPGRAIEILNEGESYLKEEEQYFSFYYALSEAYYSNGECVTAKDYLEKALFFGKNDSQKEQAKRLTDKIESNCH